MARPITMDELAERAGRLYQRQQRGWAALRPEMNRAEFDAQYARSRTVAKDLGKTLAFAKRQVERGGWGKWLKAAGVPATSAGRFIQRRNDP